MLRLLRGLELKSVALSIFVLPFLFCFGLVTHCYASTQNISINKKGFELSSTVYFTCGTAQVGKFFFHH